MAVIKETAHYQQELKNIREAGTLKEERYIHSPQAAPISVEYPSGSSTREVLNFCANNYLGLSSHPEIIKAAHEGLDQRGFGLSSVRFICGTQDIHRELEKKMSEFLGTEDTILFSSCMAANMGLFGALLDEKDAIISDKLIHASMIDGIRLCKADRHIYNHVDMADLEQKLKATQDKRFRMIVTDGVFSMDGDMAPMDEIVRLGGKYNAIVMFDDSHATGFIGRTGRGTHELKGVFGKVDIITTTLGKALGGAAGGCISASKEIVEICRQRARPYLFSNTLPPMIVAATLKVLELLSETTERRDKLQENTLYFREKITADGFDLIPGETPIVPIMLYNAKLAGDFSKDLYNEGIYVIGFSYPVVPKGEARIRVQLSAAHVKEHLDKALAAFSRIGKKYKILSKSRSDIIEMYGL